MRARELPPLRLDPPAPLAGAVTESVAGWDPAAPRPLILWRLENGRAARLAETQSERTGRFQFPGVAASGRELVVTAAGDEPDTASARTLLRPPLAGPPSVQVFFDKEDAFRLRVWPSASAAAVLAASGGREILRRSVPALPEARDRTLDLRVLLPSEEITVWIAEERDDGSRSAWVPVSFDSPATEIAGPASP